MRAKWALNKIRQEGLQQHSRTREGERVITELRNLYETFTGKFSIQVKVLIEKSIWSDICTYF